METNNCTVCGLHKGACLHQMQLIDDRNDRRVTRIVWFLFGFVASSILIFYLLK